MEKMKKNRIFSYPSPFAPSNPNPYLKVFYKNLARHGYHWCGNLTPTAGWLRENRDKFEILHFNWPEFIWRIRYTGIGIIGPVSAWKLARFRKFLTEAKKLKKILVFTLHNLEPHDHGREIDNRGLSMMCGMCDIIISHSAWAAEEAVRLFNADPDKIVVMYHGNYRGAYPAPLSKGEVSKRIGFNGTRPIVGCFGSIRAYKGFGTAVEAMLKINGAQLLIAGQLNRFQRVLHWISRDMDVFAGARRAFGSRMVTVLDKVGDQEFADLMNACDIIIVPYTKVTGSSALLTALTFSKPVIVSDLPYFREILNPEPKAFLTFKSGSADSLAEAVKRMLSSDLYEAGQAAKRLADRYEWEKVIKPLVARLQAMELNRGLYKR